MTATHSHADMLPRGTLILAGTLAAFTLTLTAVYRIAGVPPSASTQLFRGQNGITEVESRNLRFTDRADGAVVITDVDTGEVAHIVKPGTQSGFIRAVMRGLARDRRMRGIDDQPPFKLTLWKDGELSLTDSATGRATEMTAFGHSNRANFAALLDRRSAAQ